MVIPPYGVGIREAIASNDLNKMKAVLKTAEDTIKAHGDLEVAFLDLKNAIEKLESK